MVSPRGSSWAFSNLNVGVSRGDAAPSSISVPSATPGPYRTCQSRVPRAREDPAVDLVMCPHHRSSRSSSRNNRHLAAQAAPSCFVVEHVEVRVRVQIQAHAYVPV